MRSKSENRSNAVSHELRQLGATVVNKLGPEVTHVIWKEGRPSTRDRARKRGAHVVSVLWVASCKQNDSHVDEQLFHVSGQDVTPPMVGRVKVRTYAAQGVQSSFSLPAITVFSVLIGCG